MTNIKVKTIRNDYDVLIGAGLLRRAGREVQRLLPAKSSRVFVITSPAVRRHWGEALEGSLGRARLKYQILEMNDGEPAKKLETVERLAEQMAEAGADRKSLVVAFGGGVVGDAAGFLASMFMRGLPVIQIPTTVVAQLDASIGGKTGVNLKAGKNLIGAFHQPLAVLVDPDVLATLEEREFRSGLFEAVKCGVIRDARLFDFMKKQAGRIRDRRRAAVQRIITDSIRVKAAVVSADERESGLRRILNFGHTVGHALEAATGYTHLLHGEAVGWGMIAASQIARDVRCCAPAVHDEICSTVAAYGPLPALSVNTEEVVARMGSDKKTVAGAIHFVLPQKIGKVKIASDVPPAIVHSAVAALGNHA
ncbi:MAG: 3-dehydroquinate synthase [Acidobacteriia bacterium]|nr:3-dehydroquinate synthase [Terriglobia bacterium]